MAMLEEEEQMAQLRLIKIIETTQEVESHELGIEVEELILFSPSFTANASYTGIGLDGDFSWPSDNIKMWVGSTDKQFFARMKCIGNNMLETEIIIDTSVAHRRIIPDVISKNVISGFTIRTSAYNVGKTLYVYGR